MYLYFLPLPSEKWTAQENQLLTHVSPARKKRIVRYVNDSDRILSLYAALIVRMGILTHTNLQEHELQFFQKENHKPFLLTDTTIHFNFSHTKGGILCGISKKGPIGVDIEKVTNVPFQIMDTVYHPQEIAYINHSSKKDSAKRFFEIWTQKEAYVKKNGTGLICDLPTINTRCSTISPSLHSWITDDFLCSVCNPFGEFPEPKCLSTDFIYRYFHNLK